VAYQTAYLKANYPVEYLAALLTSVKSNKDQTAVFLNECRQRDIPVLVPDVNDSETDFTVSTDETGKPAIRYGMSAVRNVGEGVVALIAAARADGPFADFHDFCERVDVMALNKRTIESLVKAGAFDSLGHTRKGLVDAHERIIDATGARRRERDAGIMNLFADVEVAGPQLGYQERAPILTDEYARDQRLALEKEMLGLYVSDHPLLGAQRSLRAKVECTIAEFREAGSFGTSREQGVPPRVVGGLVSGLARKYTRKGDLMATFVLEDLASAIEVMVFPRTMADYGHLLEADAIVCVKGRLDTREDEAKLIAMEITAPEIVLDEEAAPFRISAKPSMLDRMRVERLGQILRAHSGRHPVLVHVPAARAVKVMELGDEFWVDAGASLCAELRELLGEDCIV
jgi:DNA polymerase-3 subunit alpha